METFGAVFGKWTKKEPKSIRIFTKSDIGFLLVVKPYKTNGKLVILRVPFRSKAAFCSPADANLTESKKGPNLKFENLF